MHAATEATSLLLALVNVLSPGHPVDVLELLDRYAANQDRITSWDLACESSQEFYGTSEPNEVDSRYHACRICTDGERVFWRWHRWGGVKGTERFVPRDRSNYLSMLWDGETYSNYRTSGENRTGIISYNPNPSPHEVTALQCEHTTAVLMGYYLNTHERIDHVLRKAGKLLVREGTEPVNGADCFVIEAETQYGEYTVWTDPQHAYNVARVEIHMTPKKGHLYQGRPVQGERTFQVDILRFQEFGGVWAAMEGSWEYRRDSLQRRIQTTRTHLEITELVLDPDHDALASFVREDVNDGAWGWVAPYDHIKYTWQGGRFTPQFNHEIVRCVDEALTALAGIGNESSASVTEMSGLFIEAETRVPTETSRDGDDDLSAARLMAKEGGTAKHEAKREGEIGEISRPYVDGNNNRDQGQNESKRPGPHRPYCGLYCMYALLSLEGERVDFPELIKPEYLGRREGSSLMELCKMAHDHGLHAEPAARLTSLSLRDCPCRAILHVRSHPQAKGYDHYELFLGTKSGKARLFDPPHAPRLVAFRDLASHWDGKAVFISNHPIDMELLLAADRQRLLRYAIIGVLCVFIAHLGRRIWLTLVPALPRSWSLGLTVGQAALLGLTALLYGGSYHLLSEGGFLANAEATASLQKGHAGSFIPKISERRTHKLLGSGTLFIDARLTRDYQRGHLEGAISLPIDANEVVWQETTNAIPKDSRIVVYCQSAGCRYAENVGVKLVQEDFANVSVFKGGWAEWVEKHGRPERRKSRGKGANTEDADQDISI